MVGHALVPVDGSEMADEALAFALDELAPDRVTVLYVVHPSDTSHEAGEVFGPDDVLVGRTSEVLGRYEDEAVDRRAVVGRDEADEIVAYASDNDVDVVIMGSHGRSGVSRAVLGSVAEAVVRNSPVPVTVVR